MKTKGKYIRDDAFWAKYGKMIVEDQVSDLMKKMNISQPVAYTLKAQAKKRAELANLKPQPRKTNKGMKYKVGPKPEQGVRQRKKPEGHPGVITDLIDIRHKPPKVVQTYVWFPKVESEEGGE